MGQPSLPAGTPKVSVLLITYNHEKYLAQALEGALMQKADFAFEILVGEDCSKDGTRVIVEEYARRYPGIVRPFYPASNLGAVANFWSLYRMARGKYFTMLEGDDYWISPDKLRLQA